MKKIVEPHSAAIIILHEIYGLNPFIKALSRDLKKQGFDRPVYRSIRNLRKITW